MIGGLSLGVSMPFQYSGLEGRDSVKATECLLDHTASSYI